MSGATVLFVLTATLAQGPFEPTGLRNEARYLVVVEASRAVLTIWHVQVSRASTESARVVLRDHRGGMVSRAALSPGTERSFRLTHEGSPYSILVDAGSNAVEARCQGGRLFLDLGGGEILRLSRRAGPLYFRIGPADRLVFPIYAEEPAELTLLAPDGTKVWHEALPDHTSRDAVVSVKRSWRQGFWQIRAKPRGDLRITLDPAVEPPIATEPGASRDFAAATMVEIDRLSVSKDVLAASEDVTVSARLVAGDGLELALSQEGSFVAVGCPAANNNGYRAHCGFAIVDHTRGGGLCFGKGKTTMDNWSRRASLDLGFDKAPYHLQAQVSADKRHLKVTGTLESLTEKDSAVTLMCLLPVPDAVWWNDVDTQRRPPAYRTTGHWLKAPVGANGNVSQYPLACVTGGSVLGDSGLAVAVPLDHPCVFRTGYVGTPGLLYVAIDLGLTHATVKFPNKAQFGFVLYRTEAQWGFRDALRRYYELFADDFAVRVNKIGSWVCWGNLADVPNFEDFGFQYHWGPGGPPAVAYDDDHSVASFVYNDSVRYFADLGIFPTRPTREQAAKVFEELLSTPDPAKLVLSRDPKATGRARYRTRQNLLGEAGAERWLKDSLEAARLSACLDADGVYHVGYLTNRPDWGPKDWWTGRLFCNPDPDIPGGYGQFLFSHMLEPDFERYRAEGAELDGVGLDNYFTYANLLNFRQEHFAYVDYPLSFDPNTLRPAAVGDFITYEWVAELSRRMHEQGKWLIANQCLWPYPFAARVLDIHGFEWGIQRSGPIARALAYHKPVVSLPVADEHYQEPFVRDHVRFGFLPGGYAQRDFAERPGVRSLYRRYMPALLACARAGWEPVTHARSNAAAVKVERFGRPGGELLLSIVSQLDQPTRTRVFVEATPLGLALKTIGTQDLISGRTIDWRPEADRLVADVALDAAQAIVLRLHPSA